jgi:hypothetical protein
MRTVLSKIILLNAVIFLLFSCKKDETQAVATTGTSAALNASQNTLVLTKANQSQTAVTFSLTAADFGFQAAVSNVLQIAKKGTNFVGAKEVTLDAKATSKSYTTLDFNALMLSMGLPTGVVSDVDVRIVSKISETVAPSISNVVSLKVTPYALVAFLYAVGDFVGWNINNPDSLISATSNGIYIGVLDFRTSGSRAFLLVPAKSFNNKYADGGPGKLAFNSGGDLIAPSNYHFQVTANLNDNTIKYDKLSWGVIGDATPGGWGGDTDMLYNNGTRTWSITLPLIGGKEMKFRLNDDWGTNFGAKNAGILDTENDNNIKIPGTGTSNYRITADFVNKTYTLVKL